MNRIKFLKDQLNQTSTFTANELNLSLSTFSQYESEIRAIPKDKLLAFADYFHVTIDYLLNYSDLGLFVYYENSDRKFLITESDYLKYKDEGLIHFLGNKRFVNINKKIGISESLNLSVYLDVISSYDDIEKHLENGTIDLLVPLDKSDIIKKIITLDEEKFKVIKQMLEIM